MGSSIQVPVYMLGNVSASASGARRVLTSCSAGASGMYDLAVTAGQTELSETLNPPGDSDQGPKSQRRVEGRPASSRDSSIGEERL